MIISNRKLPMLKIKKTLQGKKKFFLTNCLKYETISQDKYRKENINA